MAMVPLYLNVNPCSPKPTSWCITRSQSSGPFLLLSTFLIRGLSTSETTQGSSVHSTGLESDHSYFILKRSNVEIHILLPDEAEHHFFWSWVSRLSHARSFHIPGLSFIWSYGLTMVHCLPKAHLYTHTVFHTCVPVCSLFFFPLWLIFYQADTVTRYSVFWNVFLNLT